MPEMKTYRVSVIMSEDVDLFNWEEYIPEQRAFRDRVRSELRWAFGNSLLKNEIRLMPLKGNGRDFGDAFNVLATKRAARAIKRKVGGVLNVKHNKREKKAKPAFAKQP